MEEVNKCLQDLDPKASLHKEGRDGDFGRWKYRSRSPLDFPSKICKFEWWEREESKFEALGQWRVMEMVNLPLSTKMKGINRCPSKNGRWGQIPTETADPE